MEREPMTLSRIKATAYLVGIACWIILVGIAGASDVRMGLH